MALDTQAKIAADLKEAMKARDALRKNVLKSLKSALDLEGKQAGQKGLDEAAVMAVVKRQLKQRKEAAEVYAASGSDERAQIETAEAEIIAGYLPQQLDSEEISKHVDEAISRTAAQSVRDLGAVMGALSSALAGRADMKEVAAVVRERLGA